jgi:hypothetical protein
MARLQTHLALTQRVWPMWLALLLSIPIAQAAVVQSTAAPVTLIYSFSEFGTGDVVFKVANATPTTCNDGFWLRPSDPGFKTLYGMLMAAYHTKAPVTVQAYDDQKWPGSGGNYCRVYVMFHSP